ncbi:MAG TPA: hypothetical protein VGK23_11380 [Methanomassiliicoccales archaeon]|jgi:hypothetical protein
MTKTSELYAKEIYKNLKYRPTWLPGTPLALGTVGHFVNDQFIAVTDLTNLGIPFEETIDPDKDDIDFTSKKGVSITFKAAGETNDQFKAVAKAEAGALVEFSKEGAVVLQLRDVSLNRISDQAKLSRDMLRAINDDDEAKKWQRDWVVVTEVAKAGSSTIFISESKKSRLELKASGSAMPTSLVDASANLSIATLSDVSTKVLAEAGLTPLFRGLRVKQRFFGLFDDVTVAFAREPSPEEIFEEIDPTKDVKR